MITYGACPCGITGTLVDGRCAFCERLDTILRPAVPLGALGAARPARPRTVNALMAALVAELADEAVPDPLAQPLTLAAVWADLCRLSGEEPPAILGALTLDAPAPDPSPAPIVRGSFRDHARQFPEVR